MKKVSKQTINRLIEQQRKQLIREQSYSLNCATTPLSKAVEYAQSEFSKVGKDLYDVIPDFDENYLTLQKKIKQYALGIPRIDMPVIEPQDMKKFYTELQSGAVDIFAPWFNPKDKFPKDLTTNTGKEWVRLGYKDGKSNDDQVKGKWAKISASKLKPTQDEIWLENMIPNIIKFGVPTEGGSITKAPLIASKEGYILDGHHRFGTVQLCNPDLKMFALWIPITIDVLVPMARSFGNAIGNAQKA